MSDLREVRAAVLDAIIQGGPPERLGGRILAIIDAALSSPETAPDAGPAIDRADDGLPLYKSQAEWNAVAERNRLAALSSPETTPAGTNDREREHREEDATGRHWWRCVPLIETTPAGVLPDGHSLLLEAMEWIGIVAVTGAKAEDAERWLREHDDGRGDWDFSPAGVLDEAAIERLLAIEVAAREYLAHDGSGLGLDADNPWGGDYDGPANFDNLRALRAALGRSGSDR